MTRAPVTLAAVAVRAAVAAPEGAVVLGVVGVPGALGALARAGVAAAEPVVAAPVEGVVREAQLEAPEGLARAGVAAAEPVVAAPVGVVAPVAREARREELAPVEPGALVGPVAVAGLAARGSGTAQRAQAGLPSTTAALAASIIGIPATRGM
jgi:hypothetical protein